MSHFGGLEFLKAHKMTYVIEGYQFMQFRPHFHDGILGSAATVNGFSERIERIPPNPEPPFPFNPFPLIR